MTICAVRPLREGVQPERGGVRQLLLLHERRQGEGTGVCSSAHRTTVAGRVFTRSSNPPAPRFAGHGYDDATIRSFAADAGVDPAFVHHFYGTKVRHEPAAAIPSHDGRLAVGAEVATPDPAPVLEAVR